MSLLGELFRLVTLLAAIGCLIMGFYFGTVQGDFARGAYMLLLALLAVSESRATAHRQEGGR